MRSTIFNNYKTKLTHVEQLYMKGSRVRSRIGEYTVLGKSLQKNGKGCNWYFNNEDSKSKSKKRISSKPQSLKRELQSKFKTNDISTFSSREKPSNELHKSSISKPNTVHQWRKMHIQQNKPDEDEIKKKSLSTIKFNHTFSTSTYNQMFFPSLVSVENSNSKMEKIDRLNNYFINNDIKDEISQWKADQGQNNQNEADQRKSANSRQDSAIRKSMPKTPPVIKVIKPSSDPIKLAKDKEILSKLNEKELESEYFACSNKIDYSKKQTKSICSYIDWKDTKLYKGTVSNYYISFNAENSNNYFNEQEINYFVMMIQERKDESIKEDSIKSLYMKCSITLYKLIEYLEINKTKYYQQVMQLYKEANIENALKLVMRCQKLLKAKSTLIYIFKQIIKREEISRKFKTMLELCNDGSVDEKIKRSISEDSIYFFKLSHNICENISKLPNESKIFEKVLFVFDRKIYEKHIKMEVIGVKRIISLQNNKL